MLSADTIHKFIVTVNHSRGIIAVAAINEDCTVAGLILPADETISFAMNPGNNDWRYILHFFAADIDRAERFQIHAIGTPAAN